MKCSLISRRFYCAYLTYSQAAVLEQKLQPFLKMHCVFENRRRSFSTILWLRIFVWLVNKWIVLCTCSHNLHVCEILKIRHSIYEANITCVCNNDPFCNDKALPLRSNFRYLGNMYMNCILLLLVKTYRAIYRKQNNSDLTSIYDATYIRRELDA